MSGPRYDDPIDDGRETADLDGRSSVRVQAQPSRTPARSVSRVHDAVDADELAEGAEQLARLADEDLPLGELAYSHAEASRSSDVRTDETFLFRFLFLATGRASEIQQLAYAGLRKRSELAR